MKKQEKHDEHEFAFYYSLTSVEFAKTTLENKPYELDDKALSHRITTILRLREGESFVLFDATHHAKCTILKLDKRVALHCEKLQENKVQKPHLTFLLPILKRESFEDAIYSLTEIGINEIQPIITAKTHRHVNTDKDNERLHRIMYAAAEQSKNFALPTLKQPLPFTQIHQVLKTNHNFLLFFDPEGKPVHDVFDSLKSHQHITLMIGPEGDLTAEEKTILKQLSFTFCALTPTILRAQQAASIAAGLVRSLL